MKKVMCIESMQVVSARDEILNSAHSPYAAVANLAEFYFQSGPFFTFRALLPETSFVLLNLNCSEADKSHLLSTLYTKVTHLLTLEMIQVELAKITSHFKNPDLLLNVIASLFSAGKNALNFGLITSVRIRIGKIAAANIAVNQQQVRRLFLIGSAVAGRELFDQERVEIRNLNLSDKMTAWYVAALAGSVRYHISTTNVLDEIKWIDRISATQDHDQAIMGLFGALKGENSGDIFVALLTLNNSRLLEQFVQSSSNWSESQKSGLKLAMGNSVLSGGVKRTLLQLIEPPVRRIANFHSFVLRRIVP